MIPEKEGDDYARGYRNGYADASLGFCYIIALASLNADYRLGYLNGQLDYQRREG